MRTAAVNEASALGIHLRFDLLAHGAAQQICFTEAVAGEDLRRLHDLFLVDEDAVCFGENAFEQRVRIFDRHAPVLAVAEHADIVHRPGPVESDKRDNIAEVGWPHARQSPPHALRFQLEYADRVAALEQLVDGRIVPAKLLEVDVNALLGEQALALLEDGQRLEAKEVELHQTRRFDIFHVELRDRHVRARVTIERHQLLQSAVANNDAGGVGRRVARKPFELHRQVEQAANIAIVAIFGGQLRHAV